MDAAVAPMKNHSKHHSGTGNENTLRDAQSIVVRPRSPDICQSSCFFSVSFPRKGWALRVQSNTSSWSFMSVRASACVQGGRETLLRFQSGDSSELLSAWSLAPFIWEQVHPRLGTSCQVTADGTSVTGWVLPQAQQLWPGRVDFLGLVLRGEVLHIHS